jgi:hypothetical protein
MLITVMVTGDRRQATGDRRQEKGDRRQRNGQNSDNFTIDDNWESRSNEAYLDQATVARM